ncbi:LysR family transcriptional regulator [Pseudomonas fluorescens]|uniref:Putative LysR family transcriptional regulator n=1 Tax=Pseudomonas fluorescens (strain Pf0-1) TaxID=205922 RepID=Q3KB37_PSEPF|nr:LysR family transcriptional regulator [Pseudomonas fluorescens]ABA75017.1 putative LysR family transcriptional regulator [Pseudomonas fluorescens Pf0-1]MBY9024762.1 LysR family transcriptional regulator [Pseudomonas fluorescens]MBY9030723.1 LysR family transcriptional regulator [Pseudomonas fluorescens]MBY9036726.1 LysR family transcriptional regulator [Pseudomonas fluorescens]MBY9042832.1 LysR family transcriptional regulator [Pseudomonas fluorescens]
MKTPSTADLPIFLCIAQHLNFSRAAVDLGLTPSALSHSLRALENRLGVRLFNRTTRSVALTEAGERLYARLKPAFRDIDDALEDLNHFRDKPSGNLRITAGRQACELVLLPIASEFLKIYPDIRLEVVESDALLDIVASGFDAGVRFGNRLEADMVSMPIGPNLRSVVVGAPGFFERHPAPQKPEDLHALPCIRHRFPSGSMYRWEFERGGIEQEIEINGPLTLGDVSLMIGPALQGLGLAYVFENMAREHLASGRLVQVLADWCPYYPGLHLYYPSRRHVPAPLKAFIDFARNASEGKTG